MISTRDLSGLPDVGPLRRLMQSIAVLDAILEPEWELRYFSFDAHWAPGEQMGSMRNGQGDHYFSLFNAAGCWLKGFDHEAPMSPHGTVPPRVLEGMFDGTPAEFGDCLKEPAFATEDTTFCVWRRNGDAGWQRGKPEMPAGRRDPDGSARLLQYLDGRPETYRKWAEEYYEREVSLAAVKTVYAHKPLDDYAVVALNPKLRLSDVRPDLSEIGYPAP